MPKRMVLMGLFGDVEPTSEALDGLRLLGVREQDMTIMMGVPHSSKMLGRPKIYERIPLASILGALTGFMAAIALAYGTQWLYPIRVGGRPFTGNPTSIVPIYELTMLGLVLGTFLNLIWKCGFPSTKPQYYDPIINQGRIALMCTIDMRYEDDVRRMLVEKGAERVVEPERRPL